MRNRFFIYACMGASCILVNTTMYLIFRTEQKKVFSRLEKRITSCENLVRKNMSELLQLTYGKMQKAPTRGRSDQSDVFRYLDPRQKKVLALFETQAYVTARSLSEFLGVSMRLGTDLCQRWVKQGFFVVQNPSNKMRSYSLAAQYQ